MQVTVRVPFTPDFKLGLQGLILNDRIVTIALHMASSASSPAILGTVNGAGQTAVSLARAIGPTGATSLFSFGVERGVWWGYSVFAIGVLGTCGAMVVARLLPDEDKEHEREE